MSKRWVVFRGHKPGVYALSDLAMEQAKGFSQAKVRRYPSQRSALKAYKGAKAKKELRGDMDSNLQVGQIMFKESDLKLNKFNYLFCDGNFRQKLTCQNKITQVRYPRQSIGAWAFLLCSQHEKTSFYDGGGRILSARASDMVELKAIERGLAHTLELGLNDKPLAIVTDNITIVKYARQNIEAILRQQEAEPLGISEPELWAKIASLSSYFPRLFFCWTKGHNGNPYNEYVHSTADYYLKPALHVEQAHSFNQV